jgi:hypothetical protein
MSGPTKVLPIAIGLGVLLAVGVVIAGYVVGSSAPTTASTSAPPTTSDTRPIPLVPVNAPAATGPECAGLLRALPAELTSGPGKLAHRAVAEPAPPGTAAWGPGPDPVVLRCGLDRPAELTPTAELLEVSGVRWLRVAGDAARSSWYAVDRPVYLVLTVSDDAGSGPLQDVSAAVRAALAPVTVRTQG